MPRASRTLRGNKRMGVFDRLIVPENGYSLPPPLKEREPELPLHPVGKRVWIANVIIYEVSISYEGKPQKFVKTIPFSEIVGDPVTNEQIQRGYQFETPQGETLLVKWYVGSNRENQGLVIHNLSAKGTSWYEPNWGQVYGVGLEWFSCDGQDGGVIWANRHLGYSRTDSNGNVEINPYTQQRPPDYAPHAVRGGLMLGNPEPEKTLWLMGQGLPLQVYPALGRIGYGCLFGFNKNVMAFLTVKQPVPPLLDFTGAATNRGDVVSVRWRKDELHSGYTRVGMQVLQGSGLITRTNPDYPTDGSLALISPPSLALSGGADLRTIYFNNGGGTVRIRLLLLECDAAGNPQYVLHCTENIWVWVAGQYSGRYFQEECSGPLPFPIKEEDVCGSGGGSIIIPPPMEDEFDNSLSYFCDNSVNPSEIDTRYWNIPGSIVREGFWEGRNDLLQIFQNSDPSIQFTRGHIATGPFHMYLYKMVKDLAEGRGVEVDSHGWPEFKVWCEREGLTCLTDLQKASLYCSYRLGVPVNVFPSASAYTQGDTLTVLMDMLAMLPRGIYDWVDFNDVAEDTGDGVTGAFAIDVPLQSFAGFKSYVNFEPQALQFGISVAKAHRPVDYVKLPGSMWGAVTWVDWSNYNLPNMTSSNYLPYVVGEVGIHEIGHAVSYYGLDVYGQALHEMPEWLNISGWSSANATHLSKSRAADETGGMPLTDDGNEAPVTDYGCFNPAEDFAEAFRMYVINPTFLEDKYPQKFAFMLNKVEPMFG